MIDFVEKERIEGFCVSQTVVFFAQFADMGPKNNSLLWKNNE